MQRLGVANTICLGQRSVCHRVFLGCAGETRRKFAVNNLEGGRGPIGLRLRGVCDERVFVDTLMGWQ